MSQNVIGKKYKECNKKLKCIFIEGSELKKNRLQRGNIWIAKYFSELK